MKVNIYLRLITVATLLLALAPAAARAQGEAHQVSGSQLRPELYVRQIKGTPRSGTRLRVQIANRGNVASLPCTLTVDIFDSNAFNPQAMRESLDLPVPALEPGRTAWVVTEQIETNFVRADARNNVTPILPFRLTVDSKDDNPEFDEKNNVTRYRALDAGVKDSFKRAVKLRRVAHNGAQEYTQELGTRYMGDAAAGQTFQTSFKYPPKVVATQYTWVVTIEGEDPEMQNNTPKKVTEVTKID